MGFNYEPMGGTRRDAVIKDPHQPPGSLMMAGQSACSDPLDDGVDGMIPYSASTSLSRVIHTLPVDRACVFS